jgi:CMP/dCMP kinase
MAETLSIPSHIHQEPTRYKESLWTPNFPVLTIAGPSGTGKTSVTELLRQDFGIHPSRNIKMGNLFREMFPEQVVGFQERNADVDRLMEQRQQGLMLTSTTENPVLIEARLSGYSASRARLITDKPIISFLLYCDDQERFRRIAKRQKLPLSEAKQKTQAREVGDLEWWLSLYPDLQKDLYNPLVQGSDGKPYYTYAIDTTTRTVPEVHAEMMKTLVKDGWTTSALTGSTSHPQTRKI